MSRIFHYGAAVAFWVILGWAAWVGKIPTMSVAGGADDAYVWRLSKVSFVDATASQPNLTAGTLLAPSGWTVRAAGNYVMDCVFSPPRLTLFAASRDGSLGLNIYPGMVAVWSDNPRIAQMYRDGDPYFAKVKKCEVKAPRSLAENLQEALHIMNMQPKGDAQAVPALSDELRTNVQQVNQRLAQQPGSGSVTAEAGRIRFSGMRNGTPVEGWLILIIATRSMQVSNGPGTVQFIDAPLICELYAAPGKLDSNEKMLEAMLGTIQLDPAWLRYAEQDSLQVQQIMQQAYQKVANIHNQMMQDNLRTQQKIAAIRQGTADHARQVYSDVANNRAAALDHSAQQFSLYMGDQAVYQNPATGERVQMSSRYGHAWASTTGNNTEYLLTDSPSYDPNGKQGGGSWTELQPEH
jgi:hypothetical protein